MYLQIWVSTYIINSLHESTHWFQHERKFRNEQLPAIPPTSGWFSTQHAKILSTLQFEKYCCCCCYCLPRMPQKYIIHHGTVYVENGWKTLRAESQPTSSDLPSHVVGAQLPRIGRSASTIELVYLNLKIAFPQPRHSSANWLFLFFRSHYHLLEEITSSFSSEEQVSIIMCLEIHVFVAAGLVVCRFIIMQILVSRYAESVRRSRLGYCTVSMGFWLLGSSWERGGNSIPFEVLAIEMGFIVLW